MKHSLLPLVLLLLIPFSLLYAETEVSGEIGDATWTLAGSPYILTDDVIVPTDQYLAIEAGVEVRGDPTTAIWVHGWVIAEGSEEQPILFTRNGTVQWDGFRILDASKPSVFHWCTFEYAGVYHNHIHGGAVNVGRSSAVFTHCLFQYNTAINNSSAMYISGADVYIDQSVFQFNHAGNCCVVGSDLESTVTITFSVFHNNTAGVAPVLCFYHSDVVLDHLTITGNTSDYPYDASCFYMYDNHVDMTNSILQIPQEGTWNMAHHDDPNDQIDLVYSCLWGPGYDASNVDGSNILVADPLFVDPENYDFRLQANSPCIDAGDPSFRHDSDGSRTDMGALPVVGGGGAPDVNSVLLPDIAVLPGGTVCLPFIGRFEAETGVIAVQGDLELPLDVIASVDAVELNIDGPFDLDGWDFSWHQNEDNLHFAMAGTPPLDGTGPLFYLTMTMSETVEPGSYSIGIVNLMANEGTPELSWANGSLVVVEELLGDVSLNGTVQAYDAGLILNYLAEQVELTPPALTLAEVSGDGTVGAEDASLILQYVTGTIDAFPVEGNLLPPGSGDISLTQEYTTGGGTITAMIHLMDCSSIRSGEFDLVYPTDVLELRDIYMDNPSGGELMVLPTETGERLYIANGDAEAGEDVYWVFLQFDVLANPQGVIPLVIESGRLNDYLWLEEPVTLQLEYLEDVEEPGVMPADYLLVSCYPNPFNSSTMIKVHSGSNQQARVVIYDLLGRQVTTLFDGPLHSGEQHFSWHGENVASGVYYLAVQAGGETRLTKLTLLH